MHKLVDMNELPHESRASLKEGFWFVFKHLGLTIVAGGKLSGKERVYINGDLVSEKRSIKKNSQHQFSYKDINFIVVFKVNNAFTGNIDCSLICNERTIQTLNAQMVIHTKHYVFELLLYFSIFLVLGFVVNYLNWPFYLLLLAIPIVFLFKFERPSTSFKISEKHA